MRKRLPLLLLGLLAVAQLAIPLSMVLRYETTLSEGTALKFRTAIYDPFDPFRGRYVRLNFEFSRFFEPAENIALDADDGSKNNYYNKQVYVLFAADENGFATIAAISENKPEEAGPWLHTRASGSLRNGRRSLRLHLPFDKYFMNEKAAPQAERIYIEASRQTNATNGTNANNWSDENYALVRILNGTAAMEALIVNGQPIEVLLENEGSETETERAETVATPVGEN